MKKLLFIIFVSAFVSCEIDTSSEKTDLPYYGTDQHNDYCPKGGLISLFESGKCLLEKQGFTNIERHIAFGINGCGSRYKSTGFEAVNSLGKKVCGNICMRKGDLFPDVLIEFHTN